MTRDSSLLLDADFTEPSVQLIPTTLAGINALSGATFTEWYVANVASGGITGAGGTVLSAGAGTIRYQKTWPGWNGTDMTSGYKAVEFTGTGITDHFISADTSLYDADESLCFVFCVRVLRPPASNRGFFGKRAGSAATSPGYHVQIAASGGAPTFIMCDGSTAVTASVSGTDLHALANGAPHWLAFKYNATTGRHQILAYRTAGAEAVTPAGDKTNATAFRVGGQPFLFSCETMQVLAFGMLTGAAAEAFTIDELNAIDTWCDAPSSFASYLRYSMVSPVVANESGFGLRVQHCAGSSTVTTLNHVPHAYKAAATLSTQKLGFLAESGAQGGTNRRNRLLQTDDLSNASWTKTNITAAKNAAEDPGGFTGAASLTATTDNGTVHQDYTTVIGERMVHSIFLKLGSGGTGGRLIVATSAGAEIASTAVTATSEWQRVSVAGVATTVTTRLILELDTSGAIWYATFAQAELSSLCAYQPQRAALIDRDDPEYYIDNADGSKYDPRGGKVEAVVVQNADGDDAFEFVFSTDAGGSNEDRHFIQIQDSTRDIGVGEARIYDSAGNIVSQLDAIADIDRSEEVTYISEWDAEAGWAHAYQNGVAYNTGTTVPAAAWVTGANADSIFPGCRHTNTAHLNGIVERLRIWTADSVR